MPKKPQSKEKVEKAAPSKRSPTTKKATPANTLPAATIKQSIAYIYLLSYCPLEQVPNLVKSMAPKHEALAEAIGMSEKAYFEAVLHEVCTRIVAFSQATREPGQDWVQALIEATEKVDQGLDQARAFQVLMTNIARLPGRAKPENRLHRKKGCQFCRLPCHYGYFTLVSDPQFDGLQKLLEAEAGRPAGQQFALRPVWSFTLEHLAGIIGNADGYIHLAHVSNLAYCLLMLALAKSRLTLPEEQLQKYQAINQEAVRTILAAE